METIVIHGIEVIIPDRRRTALEVIRYIDRVGLAVGDEEQPVELVIARVEAETEAVVGL